MHTEAYMKPIKASEASASPDVWPMPSSIVRLTFALHFFVEHAF